MAELPDRLLTQESGELEPEEAGEDTHIDELGISIRPVTRELANEMALSDVRGVVISSVKRDSYEESLGIQVGDVIFRMGSKDVNTAADVRRGIDEAKKNQRILLYIKTATGTRFISVPLDPQQ